MTLKQALEIIEWLLKDNRYKWAFNTLKGIQKTIIKYQTITERQEKAINNIMRGVK